ncbi:hypothetical protein DPEC_G00116000 [Dallia pectoralis]|uniref:Uncharacterized protein n=1 Tax=Dallia pectoralis TaxID=75939 RepID=A0ACC2GUT1_DALPE|nr:hypothetical protein DPEC_G00116000 [Dallia pectoralis]
MKTTGLCPGTFRTSPHRGTTKPSSFNHHSFSSYLRVLCLVSMVMMSGPMTACGFPVFGKSSQIRLISPLVAWTLHPFSVLAWLYPLKEGFFLGVVSGRRVLGVF